MLLKGESRTSRRSALRLLGLSAGAALLAACSTAPSVSAPHAAPRRRPPLAARRQPPRQPPLPLPPRSPSPPRPSRRFQRQRPRRPPLHNLAAAVSSEYSIQADLSSIDGHVRTPGVMDSLWLAFDRLTQYDGQLQPQPMLAESWDLTPDDTRSRSTFARTSPFIPAESSPATTSNGTCCARADPTSLRSVRQSEQLVHGHRHARQIHGRAYL